MNPENTFFSVKRFIGRRMDEVKEESKQVPYQVWVATSIVADMSCKSQSETLWHYGS